jgi:hypothetical protein
MTAAAAAGHSNESGEGPMTIIAERASVITNEATLRPLVPAAPRPARPAPEPRSRRAAVWYCVFAVYAGSVAVFSGPGHDRSWGIWASFGYAAAAVLAAAWPTRRGRLAALAASLAGALAAPVVWLATQATATPDVAVVTRSGAMLLHHGSPYLPLSQLAHGGFLAYNPYLPVMAVFGLPRALGLPGLAGDPRPWLAVDTFVLLAAAFRIALGERAWTGRSLRLAAFAVASPVLAFPLAEGITDPPVVALTCLALALLAGPARAGAGRARSAARPGAWLAPGAWAAAITIGVACAMKYTAWPAVGVLAAMVAARDGARSAARFAATAVGAAAVLTAGLAPAAMAAPAALIQNTLAYPLGLTRVRTPAQSPLPGHMLATLGPAGHLAAIMLLIAAGLGIAASLVTRPPADGAAAARRLALGLALMFALSPATRFGYFAYPAGLYGFLALTGQATSAGRLLPLARAAADSVPSWLSRRALLGEQART